jgi:hypothetical protein
MSAPSHEIRLRDVTGRNTHVCTNTHKYVHLHTHVHTCMWAYAYTQAHIDMPTPMNTYAHTPNTSQLVLLILILASDPVLGRKHSWSACYKMPGANIGTAGLLYPLCLIQETWICSTSVSGTSHLYLALPDRAHSALSLLPGTCAASCLPFHLHLSTGSLTVPALLFLLHSFQLKTLGTFALQPALTASFKEEP